MIGSTLFRYFLWRYFVMTIQFLVGVTVISFLADFAEFARRSATLANFTVTTGLLISGLRIPLVVQTAIPFVILFSSMATLMTLNRKYELVITRSAGVSAWQFLAPLCVGSLVIGILTTTVLNPIAAHALSVADLMEASVHGDTGSSNQPVPWLRQSTKSEGVTIIGAAKTAKRGLFLSDATFLRLNGNDEITARLDARTAELKNGAWHLVGVTKYVGTKDRETMPTATIKSGLKPGYIEESLADPALIPFFELHKKIAAARSFGLNAGPFAMQYHSLVAIPMFLVAMTLIAATVSMRFVRMGQSAPMILGGILAGFLLYVVSVLVKAFGSAGIVPPVVAAWFPVVVAMFFGVTFLLHKEDG